ncbi:MAG: hypothetical protein WC341_12130, partial [Bacteroidales bacterium]
MNFKTVLIKVIAPAPENLIAEPLGAGVNLTWDPSVCENAIGYKIYRRSGASGWEPGYCETGVPAYTGFRLVKEITDGAAISFRDDNDGTGLVVGVNYCYRVTATFFDGAESLASNEACAYLKRDVPIITHVTNDSTDLTVGRVFIDWAKPVDLDTIQYPGPYKYILQRNEGVVWSNPVQVAVFSGLNDTSYMDSSVNLNTFTDAYSYRVDLESETIGFIGSSHPASSIFVVADPTDRQVSLSWDPIVPWTNETYSVYQKDPGASDYQFIGSTRELSFKSSGLTNEQAYCFYVVSSGSYSIPGLPDPLINYSQLVCSTPVDN